MKNSEEYRLIFSEIINGYSSVIHSNFSEIFIKHFTYLEIGELDIKYSQFLKDATNKGLPTYSQREESIIKEGLWTQNDDLNLVQNERFVQDLKINYSKDYLPSRRARMKKDISEAEIKLDGLRLKKDHAIGSTAESFAYRKLMYHKILKSFYTNNLCNDYLIKNEDELEDKNYDELIKLYNDYQNKINDEAIKRISIAPFFTNIFYLSSDNARDFYGKPILELTNHQANVFSYGRYFKNILSEYGSSLPKEIQNNPDELIDWIEVNRNAREQKVIGDDNNQGGTGSIVGATKSDLKTLGIEAANDSLQKELKKKGGTLTKDDLFRLTG